MVVKWKVIDWYEIRKGGERTFSGHSSQNGPDFVPVWSRRASPSSREKPGFSVRALGNCLRALPRFQERRLGSILLEGHSSFLGLQKVCSLVTIAHWQGRVFLNKRIGGLGKPGGTSGKVAQASPGFALRDVGRRP